VIRTYRKTWGFSEFSLLGICHTREEQKERERKEDNEARDHALFKGRHRAAMQWVASMLKAIGTKVVMVKLLSRSRGVAAVFIFSVTVPLAYGRFTVARKSPSVTAQRLDGINLAGMLYE
jgi:hypothetical protein